MWIWNCFKEGNDNEMCLHDIRNYKKWKYYSDMGYRKNRQMTAVVLLNCLISTPNDSIYANHKQKIKWKCNNKSIISTIIGTLYRR